MMDIENVNPELASFLNSILWREGSLGWAKSVYKGTDCGAWIRVEHDTVSLGSIVEGSDFDTDTISLQWPFTEKCFWDALDEIELEADIMWREANELD